MTRDPNLGRVISKSTGVVFWWNRLDPLPPGDDLAWVDEPVATPKDVKESHKGDVTKVGKIDK